MHISFYAYLRSPKHTQTKEEHENDREEDKKNMKVVAVVKGKDKLHKPLKKKTKQQRIGFCRICSGSLL